MVESMEKQGVIKPSTSPWSSPVVLAPKKDGSLRFCIDYRKLNSMMEKDVYPLPRIDDILDTLGETRYFTSLDLAAGYWQIEMDPESCEKSAFVTHQGLHEFVRMPFGLCNAPATFQRLIEVVLAGLVWKCVFAYIDDVLVCSRTFEDHLRHLEQVFARLRQAGLRLKPQKCLFLREKVPYLGYIVTREGIVPDQAKTEKILSYPVPVDVARVRQFLGLASYYRHFVPGFAKAAAPLHALLKKDANFHWTQQCQESFDHLKELLVTPPVLAYPQFQSEHPFILETDASTEGLGAVLAQQQSDGKVHPIAYASRSLNPHERNYGITELETLGLVWAVKTFRAYLLGHHCVVYTDHSACTSLLKQNTPHQSWLGGPWPYKRWIWTSDIELEKGTLWLMPCLGTLFPQILHQGHVAKCCKWILSLLLQTKPQMQSCNSKIVRLVNCNGKMRSSHLSSGTWKMAFYPMMNIKRRSWSLRNLGLM